MASSSDDNNYHPWKQTAWQARQAVSEALVALPADYPPRKSIAVSEYHELAQTYLFEYFSVFEPKKDEFGGGVDPEDEDAEAALWFEPLTAVHIPVSGSIRLNGNADVLKAGKDAIMAEVAGQIPERRAVVTLANVRQLYQTENTFQINVKGWVENQGVESESVGATRYLPVAGIHAVRAQLDRCLEHAGWLPNITPDTEDAVITEEDIQFAPDEVKERILPEGDDE